MSCGCLETEQPERKEGLSRRVKAEKQHDIIFLLWFLVICNAKAVGVILRRNTFFSFQLKFPTANDAKFARPKNSHGISISLALPFITFGSVVTRKNVTDLLFTLAAN